VVVTSQGSLPPETVTYLWKKPAEQWLGFEPMTHQQLTTTPLSHLPFLRPPGLTQRQRVSQTETATDLGREWWEDERWCGSPVPCRWVVQVSAGRPVYSLFTQTEYDRTFCGWNIHRSAHHTPDHKYRPRCPSVVLTDERIFIYPDASSADFYIQIIGRKNGVMARRCHGAAYAIHRLTNV